MNNLRDQGWTHIIVTTDDLGTYIEADNPGGATQLFQVKTAASPDTPSTLTESEKNALISRANQIGAVPYEVKVFLIKAHVKIQYHQL